MARDEHGHPLPDTSATQNDGDCSDDGSGGGGDGDGDGDGGNKVGFRTYGMSKDSRHDLPQIVIGMAVTRDGIPVRVSCWPGNTNDQALIRQVKHDMRNWTLSKIVWVADRGFASEHNRRYLREGDHAYIIGEKLRSDSPEIKAALSRQGRYTDTADNMRVKEVKVSDTERFVICHNPDAATRDAHIREQLVAQPAGSYAQVPVQTRLGRDPAAELTALHRGQRVRLGDELVELLPVSFAAVSQHLGVLRSASLVTVRAEGQCVVVRAIQPRRILRAQPRACQEISGRVQVFGTAR